ncbi:MAG TPA: hypothetical protein VFZ48_04955, partial [Candidatus Saccharimonadales bacterium]
MSLRVHPEGRKHTPQTQRQYKHHRKNRKADQRAPVDGFFARLALLMLDDGVMMTAEHPESSMS